MRAVVTGGAGFIGSHVVDALLARGDEVHVVDNLATGRRENVDDAATLHEHDIREPLDGVFAEVRPEVVVHLAAQADVGTSVAQPRFDARGERARDAQRARGGARRTARSSSSARPAARSTASASVRRARTTPREPVSPYGTSKLAAEEYLATWNRLYGTRHVALRFANVYGPRQLAKLEGGVVAIFSDRLRAGESVTDLRRRPADARLRLRRRRRRRGARGDRRRRRHVQRRHGQGDLRASSSSTPCAASPASTPSAEHAPARPGEARRSVLDASRAERELGWRPRFSLEEGLRATWSSSVAA